MHPVRRSTRVPLLGCLTLLFCAAPAAAFPPYRSTDADTAGADMLELRLGLLRIQRRDSMSERSTPLTRTNFGIGAHYEVISELEYSPDDHRLAEGAVGFKWANFADGFGIGVETLILLPVQSGHSGTGIESQFLTTFRQDRWQLHMNAGGFYDPRGAATAHGWRASVLAEFPRERFRPGVELFAKDVRSGEQRVQAGVGVITQLEHFEIRSGLHFGLNDEAPDIEASVWFSWQWNVNRSGGNSVGLQPDSSTYGEYRRSGPSRHLEPMRVARHVSSATDVTASRNHSSHRMD
jgi:hypothetical protein